MFSFFSKILYIKLSAERLTIRDPKDDKTISEVPEIAFSNDKEAKVIAIGTEVQKHRMDSSIKIINPFAHPRSLLSDLTNGEKVLQQYILRIYSNRTILPVPPIVIMHPQGTDEGGYTQIEIRCLREMTM